MHPLVKKIIKKIDDHTWIVELKDGSICEWKCNQYEHNQREDFERGTMTKWISVTCHVPEGEKMKCTKCLTEDGFFVQYTDLERTYSLCSLCNAAFDQPVTLMKEFLKEDFGKFPIDQITKNIIDARRNRALGKSPWEKVRKERMRRVEK